MKKLKLLLSICALCLSLSVLCIGIYAAQTVTYTISGTISYTVEDVFATISAKVFKVSGQQSDSTMQIYVSRLATTALDSIADTTYIEDTTNLLNGLNTTTGSSASDTITIDMQDEYLTYYIVINISNLTDKEINAKLTDSTTYTNLNKASQLIQDGIAKGDTKNLVVAFSLADKKVETSELAINYSIEVGYDPYYSKTFADNFLKEDATNGYYYTELGTLSDGTAIRWRLVSLDGTSRYDYEAGNAPARHEGAIFLQETYLGSTVAFDACDDTSRTDYNNYYKSDIRTTINTLSTWNLTESDISSLITKKNIKKITWYRNSLTIAYTGTTDDYFWLMSQEEISTYFNGMQAKRWYPINQSSTVSWWDRTPCEENQLYFIETNGFTTPDDRMGIRAAFQLA